VGGRATLSTNTGEKTLSKKVERGLFWYTGTLNGGAKEKLEGPSGLGGDYNVTTYTEKWSQGMASVNGAGPRGSRRYRRSRGKRMNEGRRSGGPTCFRTRPSDRVELTLGSRPEGERERGWGLWYDEEEESKVVSKGMRSARTKASGRQGRKT